MNSKRRKQGSKVYAAYKGEYICTRVRGYFFDPENGFHYLLDVPDHSGLVPYPPDEVWDTWDELAEHIRRSVKMVA